MNILIVEDSSVDRELLVFALQEHYISEAKFREVGNLQSARDYLERGVFDCVILDLHLPDSSGIDTFLTLHNAYPEIPIVVVSNTTDLQLALRMIRLGAEDFIVKNFTNTTMIFRRVAFAIERKRRNTFSEDLPDGLNTDEEPVPDTQPSNTLR